METTGLLNEVAHPGRPRDEEPHIKRSVKKKKEMIEYIVRVNLQELEIDENNFEELQELFRMFDNDKDGVLSLKEFEKILSVLGRSATEDNAKKIADSISVDKTEFSVSFNEYLALMGKQNKVQEPSADALLECFEIFDIKKSGRLTEAQFRTILRGKVGDEDWEIEEMLAEYRRIHVRQFPPTPEGEEYIDYKKLVAMLQD